MTTCTLTLWTLHDDKMENCEITEKDDIMDKDNITDIKNDNWEKYDDSVNKDV